MELKDFISKSLTEIAYGVKEANSIIGEGTFEIEAFRRESDRGYIQFDIAVTTTDEVAGKVDGGIKVLDIGIGSNITGNNRQQEATRIKFSILPAHHIR